MINRLGEINPQLFRELKGRLQPRNIVFAVAISFLVQLSAYIKYGTALPSDSRTDEQIVNRYCIGAPSNWDGSHLFQDVGVEEACVNDAISWQLWSLDIFIFLSLAGIFALLVAGTWMLIADLSREERRGTLDFIRSSPQSVRSIMLGKMLGVPFVIYLAVALAIPVHIVAGLLAHISLGLILAFYAIAAISCVFFYSAALLFALSTTGLGVLQPWLGSSAVLLFLYYLTGWWMTETSITYDAFDMLTLFYPGTFLVYLTNATALPPPKIGYFILEGSYYYTNVNPGEGISSLAWYGQLLWHNAAIGFIAIALHYGLWLYWLGQGLKRRFRNPSATVWSKGQSYWLSGSFAVLLFGFALHKLKSGFGTVEREEVLILQLLVLFFFLMLMAVLNPQRQTLRDWARYRHQKGDRQGLMRDLVLGEQSPSTVAIAINAAIFLVVALPPSLLFGIEIYAMPILVGLLLQGNMMTIYAAISQLILMMKTSKRAIVAAFFISILAVFPFVFLAIASPVIAKFSNLIFLLLFVCIPGVVISHFEITAIGLAIIAQWFIIAVLGPGVT